MHWYDQRDYRVRLEWGWRGARMAAARGDILVVVDVLRFSTTAVTAVERGITLYPCRSQEEARVIAARTGAEIAEKSSASLSPLAFLNAPAGLRMALPSPNGATCCRLGAHAPHLLLGALINAGATAAALARLPGTEAITVLACGERQLEPDEDGALRFALEDYLGAGAIISGLAPSLSRSPEAKAAEAAFLAARDSLEETLLACGSGVELIAKGLREDVLFAAALDSSVVVPVLPSEVQDGEQLTAWQPG